MTLTERLRLLVSALPSDDSAVTITRADLVGRRRTIRAR